MVLAIFDLAFPVQPVAQIGLAFPSLPMRSDIHAPAGLGRHPVAGRAILAVSPDPAVRLDDPAIAALMAH
jgi:hypothetical protein